MFPLFHFNQLCGHCNLGLFFFNHMSRAQWALLDRPHMCTYFPCDTLTKYGQFNGSSDVDDDDGKD